MDLPVRRRLPCSVCGFDSFSRNGWFVVTENQLLDQLKIFVWHPFLAAQTGFQSVCGRQHLKVLLAYWLDQGNLRLFSLAEEHSPEYGEAGHTIEQLEALTEAKLIGELSVCRENSQAWAGSAETLESIFDALQPADDLPQSLGFGFQVPPVPHYPSQELSFH